MFMQMIFSKVNPVCHNFENGIKPGSNPKKTDKHAAACLIKSCMLGLLFVWFDSLHPINNLSVI